MENRSKEIRLLHEVLQYLCQRFGITTHRQETCYHLSERTPRLWSIYQLEQLPVEIAYSDPIASELEGNNWETFAVLRIGNPGSLLDNPQLASVPQVIEILAGDLQPDFISIDSASSIWNIWPDPLNCIARHNIEEPFICVAYATMTLLSMLAILTKQRATTAQPTQNELSALITACRNMLP